MLFSGDPSNFYHDYLCEATEIQDDNIKDLTIALLSDKLHSKTACFF